MRQVKALAEAGDYAQLRQWLARADRQALARGWTGLEPMHKLVAFKLMDAASAMDFFDRLPYREKYFLFSGFGIDSIAPVISGAPPSVRRLFVSLPARFYKTMLQRLAS